MGMALCWSPPSCLAPWLLPTGAGLWSSTHPLWLSVCPQHWDRVLTSPPDTHAEASVSQSPLFCGISFNTTWQCALRILVSQL